MLPIDVGWLVAVAFVDVLLDDVLLVVTDEVTDESVDDVDVLVGELVEELEVVVVELEVDVTELEVDVIELEVEVLDVDDDGEDDDEVEEEDTEEELDVVTELVVAEEVVELLEVEEEDTVVLEVLLTPVGPTPVPLGAEGFLLASAHILVLAIT